MGASAFAFASTQRAMITEGFTDALLLPSLIREACRVERLEYQVVPRFASADAEEVSEFDLIASRFVCVADGDQGGRDRAKFLEGNGVRREQILFLGGDLRSGLSLEDLIDPDTYLLALNKVLGAKKPGLEFSPGKLPAKGRSAAVKSWASAQRGQDGRKVKVPKAAVIKEILELRGTMRLLNPQHRQTLAALDKSAREQMERPRAGAT
jgi:hypothetical protein